MKSEKMRYFL